MDKKIFEVISKFRPPTTRIKKNLKLSLIHHGFVYFRLLNKVSYFCFSDERS
jgi:hypothetical protein